jgi:hypothetical protein
MLARAPYRLTFVVKAMSFAALTLCVTPIWGQQDSVFTAGEARMLSALKERFEPLPSVDRIWTGAFLAASRKTKAVKASIDSVQRSGIPEADVLVRVGALGQEMRVIKSDRNAFVAGFLTPLQQLALDSILNPPAPSIQHFGFHDRLMCLVCKKPNEGAVFPSGVKSPDQLMIPKQ